jgi:hypothetical protein
LGHWAIGSESVDIGKWVERKKEGIGQRTPNFTIRDCETVTTILFVLIRRCVGCRVSSRDVGLKTQRSAAEEARLARIGEEIARVT